MWTATKTDYSEYRLLFTSMSKYAGFCYSLDPVGRPTNTSVAGPEHYDQVWIVLPKGTEDLNGVLVFMTEPG